ncbi:hypothetical protein T492DRAFT_858735 [Pavlovales sp. CCMP2436]|nr:hypothetical protein T492DRAFT_858735 [Pavlovales sp. CCMP2436]
MEAAACIKKQLIDTIGTIVARGHAQLLLARLSALAPIAAQLGNTTNSNQQIISLNALARAHYRRSIGTRARAQDRIFSLALPSPLLNDPNASIGPIEAKLNTVKPICGIVIGAFGEMYALMGVSPMEAAARIKKQLIDTIGTIVARGHAQLLLARLSALAPIAAQHPSASAVAPKPAPLWHSQSTSSVDSVRFGPNGAFAFFPKNAKDMADGFKGMGELFKGTDEWLDRMEARNSMRSSFARARN